MTGMTIVAPTFAEDVKFNTTRYFPEWMRHDPMLTKEWVSAPIGEKCCKCKHVFTEHPDSPGDVEYGAVTIRNGKHFCESCGWKHLNGERTVEILLGFTGFRGWKNLSKDMRRLIFTKVVAAKKPHAFRVYGTYARGTSCHESAEKATKKLIEFAEKTCATAYVVCDYFLHPDFAHRDQTALFIEVYITDPLAGIMETYLDECRGNKESRFVFPQKLPRGASPQMASGDLFVWKSTEGTA